MRGHTHTADVGDGDKRPVEGGGEGAILQDFDRTTPGKLLRAVDLAQVKNLALHHTTAGNSTVLHYTPVAVLLAVLLANLGAQKHVDRKVCANLALRE